MTKHLQFVKFELQHLFYCSFNRVF